MVSTVDGLRWLSLLGVRLSLVLVATDGNNPGGTRFKEDNESFVLLGDVCLM